jgi:tetratricopeptide (TPR) repeat protein
MSYINNNDFNLGIEELVQTLELDPNYKRSLYLVLALAYKRLLKYDEAIDIVKLSLFSSPKGWNSFQIIMTVSSTGGNSTSKRKIITML